MQDKRQQHFRDNHDQEHQEQIKYGGEGHRQSNEYSKVNRNSEQAPTAENKAPPKSDNTVGMLL